MKKIFIISIFMIMSVSLYTSLYAATNLTNTEISTKIDNIQADVPTGTPNAPSGMDKKGYVGEMLANLFDGNNKIKGFFIQAFQSIWNSQADTLPRWNGQSFTAGSIRDNGTNIGIGTGILNNRRVNIAGDVNFTGDLYRNGVLFTPTLPADIVRTTGDQTIGGIKTFTSNSRTENPSPTNYYLDTNHRSAMIHVNSNNFYVLRGAGTGSTTWASYNGRWPLQISLANNNAIFGGAGNFLGSITTQSGTFIGNGSTLTNLNASNLTSGTISSSRLPSDVVKTSGTQTIGGTKTFSSTISGSITGNAGTATKLATARKINGTLFDGSADITITAAGDDLGDHEATKNIDMNDNKITNLKTPTNDDDAATKKYVDSQITASGLSCTNVTATSTSNGDGVNLSATATCAAGYIVTGGGCNPSSYITRSQSSGNSWICAGYYAGGGPHTHTTNARCCK